MDIATQTAICRGRPGSVPAFNTFKFAGDDRLVVASSAIRWAARILEIPPDVAYLEKPMPIGAAIHGTSNAKTIVRLNTLYDIMGGACLARGVRVVGVAVQDARMAFIGAGSLERDEAKRRCLMMCKLLGWPADNKDEGDAACIWYWGSCCEAPRVAAIIHPGMMSKVASLSMAASLGAIGKA